MLEPPKAAELIASGSNLFIEASAGTGKTTLITRLVAEVIVSQRATINQILCVTYTEKAASELKAKIFDELGRHDGDAAQMARRNFSKNRIGTIHNFCLRNLREQTAMGLTATGEGKLVRDEEIFDEAREWVYRTVFAEFEPDTLAIHLTAAGFGKGGRDRSFDKALMTRALFAFATGEKNIVPNISDRSQIKDATEFRAYILTQIIARMHAIAESREALTFSRMISLFAKALDNPDIEAQVRAQYRFALVDEFQDTDVLQWSIFSKLFLRHESSRLILVGDPKQAIYKFRGADVFVYLKARETMRAQGARVESLPINFRSAPEILKFVGELFASRAAQDAWNRAGIAFTPPRFGEERNSTGATTGVEVYRTSDPKVEKIDHYLDLMAARIETLRSAQPRWSIAILAFSHSNLVKASLALKKRGIDFAYYKPKPELKRIEFEHLKIFLHSFSQPETEGFALAQATIFGHAENMEYYRRLSRHAENGRILDLLQTLAQNQRPLHLLLASEPDETLYHNWRLLFEYLLSLVGKSIFDLTSLSRALHDLLQDEDRDTLSDMLRGEKAVTLMTVQSSKGLDFDAVFLSDGGNDSRFGDSAFFHDKRGQAVIPMDIPAFDLSDDKRLTSSEESEINQLNLLYVAATRARYKFVVAVIQPGKAQQMGPTRRFIEPWLQTNSNAAQIYDLKTVYAGINPPKLARAAKKEAVEEQAPDHGDIAMRVRRRTSFTELSQNLPHDLPPSPTQQAAALEKYIEDVLPRGAQTGIALHDYLEYCDFQNITSKSHPALQQLLAKFSDESARSRVIEILEATAGARLPLAENSTATRLQDIAPGNLWREMPFWSNASLHPAASGMNATMMHGFMDLVFTMDEKDYYILDYKSNSLADIDPAKISDYTTVRYEKQAQIYSEALSAYLSKNFPDSGKRVRGCYFLFLRYLQAGATTGVHFMEHKP